MSKFLLALCLLEEHVIYYQGKLSRKTLLMAADYLISACSLPRRKVGFDRLCEILDPDLRQFLDSVRGHAVLQSMTLQQELAVYSAFKKVVINFYDSL